MTARTIPFPLYRHTAWCRNQACHAPIPSDARECPECGADQAPAIIVESLEQVPAPAPCGCTIKHHCAESTALYAAKQYRAYMEHRRTVNGLFDAGLKVVEAQEARETRQRLLEGTY